VANRVLAIRLVHWLRWVFENKERKKEKNPHGSREKKQELYSTETAPVLQCSRNTFPEHVPGTLRETPLLASVVCAIRRGLGN